MLAARCPACGVELPADARFCDGCGTPVAEPVVAAPLAQTRKTVTVVFADLAGSTGVQETLDPESVRHLMDRVYAALRAAVEAHAGVTVKFTGDGLMAGFGVQAVAEDDAWRAVQAAWAMQEAIAGLDASVDLSLRVGVNTGEVIVTEGENDVVGDAVNVAARLESAAPAGGVLVGEETWRLTRHLAEFEAVAPLVLRGKAEPVAAHRLVSLAGSALEAAIAFVGREDELGRLTSAFEDAVAARSARLTTVLGSPGLGKSRLALEFVSSLEDRATVVEARFSPTATSTFGPVVEALRAAQADASLEELVSGSPQEAFLAVRRALEGLATEQPVVLILEDLHWAEPLVLDLVEHLVEWVHGAPVLVVALARPELREMRPVLVETGGRASTVLVLEGLDPPSSERLACDLLETDALPPALLTRILTGSEGNPLFVRELVRMLVDDGVLRRDGDEWRPTIEVDAITVPPTIQSLLAARVERLPTDERTVLECAAVVGREFYRGAVADLVPSRLRRDVPGLLERLRQKEMVEPEGTYWIDQPVLRFHHVLLRDAAYRRLLKEVRADLHERYTRWLEVKVGDGADHDEVLGYHLEQAHRYRVELGIFDERTAALGHAAATRLASAGRRALDRDDLPAAAGLLGRALARIDGDDPSRPELLIDRCEALVTTGALAEGALAIAELEALVVASPRLRAWAACFAAQLAILTDPGHLPETLEASEQAATELAKLADAAGAAKAHAVHASALARLGRVAECEAALDRALAAAREAGDTRRATAVLAGAPLAALWGPSPVARASGRCLDVVRVLRITTSAATVEATSLRCQAVLEALRGRTDAARRMLAAARRSLEELGHRHGLLSTEMFAGMVELLADDPAAAEPLLRAARDGFVELGAGADAGQAAAILGRALLALGRTDEAEQLTVESEVLGGADLKTAIAWRAVRAEALAQRGSVEEALELATAAVALTEPTDALLDQADTHLALATVLQLAGRSHEAGAAATRAVELYERKGATVLAERARRLVVDAPAAAPEPEPEPAGDSERRRRVRRNAAVQACEQALRTFNRGDLDAYAALFAEDASLLDHMHSTDGEPYGMPAGWASLRTPDGAQIDLEPVAALGERHALARCQVPLSSDLAGPADMEDLRVLRVGRDGRFVWQERFRADDLHRALARLLELHAEDELEGPDQAASLRLAESCRLICPEGWGQLLLECYAEHASLVDHRTTITLGTLRGRNQLLEAFAAMTELAGPTETRLIDVLAASPMGGLLELGVDGLPPAALEFRFLVIAIAGADGLIVDSEWFDPDQLEAAHARFEELTNGTGPGSIRPNLVLATLQRFSELYRADLPRAEALASPDWRVEDRRAGMQAVMEGEAALESFRLIAGVVDDLDYEVVATRGERLSLVRMTLRGGSRSPAFEVTALHLHACDGHGRLTLNVVFDADDLDGAVEEINRLYRADEGAPFVDVLDVAERFAAAVRTHDPDALSAVYAPDARIVDHRPVGWGEVGPDEYTRLLHSMFELLPDFSVLVSSRPRVSDQGCVFTLRGTATDPAGGRVEIDTCQLLLVADGLVVRHEHFPIEAVDAVVARFDEVAPTQELDDPPPVAVPANRCTRARRTFVRLLEARDWDGLGDVLAPGIELVDHRSGIRTAENGRDEVLAAARAMAEVGVTNVDNIALATRGDRLMLSRALFRGATAEAEALQIYEIDDSDRLAHLSIFDPDDLTRALRELERRYRMGDGAPYAEVLDVLETFVAAFAERDVDQLSSILHESFCLVDHRPLGWGEIGAEGFAELVGSLFALAPDFVPLPTTFLRITSQGLVATMQGTGHDSPGGTFEIANCQLFIVEDGLIVRQETFPADALEAAGARFDELTSAPTEPTSVVIGSAAAFADRAEPACAVANLATRTLVQLAQRQHAGDEDGLRELVDEHFVLDARGGLKAGVAGADAVIANARAMGDQLHRRFTPMATRGERLALVKVEYRGSPGWSGPIEDAALELIEADEGGRALAIVTFEADDLGPAVEELDRRFQAGEGASYAPVLVTARRAFDLWGRRAWDDLRAVFSPGAVMVDRRPLGWGEIDPADFVDRVRALAQLAPDGTLHGVTIPRLHQRASLGLMRGTGTDPHGGTFEISFFCLIVLDRDSDLVSRLEFLPADDPAAASARFDEITEGSPSEREETPTLLATRGERLALVSVVVHDDDASGGDASGGEVEVIELLELDEAGLVSATVVFDEADSDAAFEELDRRFDRGEGAPYPVVGSIRDAFLGAYAARDWDAMRRTLREDLVVEDHRSAGSPRRGRDAYVDTLRSMEEEFGESRIRVTSVPRISDRAAVFTYDQQGFYGDDVQFQRVFAATISYVGGLVAAIEYFDLEDLDAAIARFDEILAFEAGVDANPLSNRASTVGGRIEARLLAGDAAGFSALFAPDAVADDRRSGLRNRGSGAEFITMLGDSLLGVTAVEPTVLATRGERLVLLRLLFIGGTEPDGRFEVELLELIEVDADDRVTAIVLFDGDDEEAAFEEMENRFNEGEAAQYLDRPALTPIVGQYNAGGWTAMEALYTADVQVVDHRPLGWGTVDGRAFVERAKSLVGLTADTAMRSRWVRVSDRGAGGHLQITGTTPDGSDFELSFLMVNLFEGDRLVRAEFFEEEEVGQALAVLGLSPQEG